MLRCMCKGMGCAGQPMNCLVFYVVKEEKKKNNESLDAIETERMFIEERKIESE